MKMFKNDAGFTLVELLVVILIIAILIAVSAPSFLGQISKAKDSAAKQNLTVAYKAAKAESVDNGGIYTDQAAYVTALGASEPQLTFVAGTSTSSDIGVAISAGTLTLSTVSDSGANCTLVAPSNGAITPASC